ncbi:MAG: T9SS type A sorting domain-containing protein [Kordia sp.]|uniref:T9SS type A sorting domain-containing protein n=1 Tax=Kordia sp. TaxID=1965332 RepID=UPI0038584C18
MKRNIFLLTLFIVFSTETHAAIRYVTPSGSGTFDGTSWANAFPGTSLQTAINASIIGDEVWVAAGTYYTTTTTNRSISFSMRNGVTIYGSFVGTEMLLSERVLTNGLTSILSGEIGVGGIADNSYKVVYNQQLNTTAIIDGFIVERGNDDRNLSNAGNGLGSGMYNHGYNPGGFCHPIVRNCLFRQNTASFGSGVFNNGYNGGTTLPTFINCVFSQNHALIAAGGMDSYGVAGTASPTIINSIFYENTSAENVGAMYAWGGGGGNSHSVLINCAFVNNSALNGYGGAFIADNLDPGGGGTSSGTCTVTLQNCIVWNNTATGTSPQFYVRGTGAEVVATYSDIDLTGQSGAHVISGAGTGNIDINPLFLDIASGAGLDGIWMTADDGLQLQNSSPCIDVGDNSGVYATDILANNRLFNTTVDMGAYEFDSTTLAIQNTTPIVELVLYPNPTKDFIQLTFNTLEIETSTVMLYDITGRLLETIDHGQKTGKTFSHTIDLSHEKSGVYFLSVQTATRKYVRKIIRE